MRDTLKSGGSGVFEVAGIEKVEKELTELRQAFAELLDDLKDHKK